MKYKIIFPDIDYELQQGQEYIDISINKKRKTIYCHDYRTIYNIPCLYEKLFHKHLKCNSPQVISDLFYNQVSKVGEDFNNLKVLDFGAGTGLMGEELRKRGCKYVVAVDILREAREEYYRIRPRVYNKYLIIDFSAFDKQNLQKKYIQSVHFNALTTISAFSHIPRQAFINAFNLINRDGWIVFNINPKNYQIKEFKYWVDILLKHIKTIYKRNYRHRFLINRQEVIYTAYIGRKINNMRI